jgi:ABC-2 type transport system ATP-binding protein
MPKAPTVIRVSNLSKKFKSRASKSVKEALFDIAKGSADVKSFTAVKDLSLDVKAGSTVGLIGHNGSGKSTLLKLMGGILLPSSGRVETRGRMAALLELGAGFHPDLSGRENVFLNAALLGLTKAEIARRFDEILSFSGVEEFIDTPVKFYSSGMYVRLAFSVAINVDPDVLLVDEVLAVGDEPFQHKCLDKIRSFQNEGRTIVFVSHSASQITDLCSSAVLLKAGRLVFDGDPTEAVALMREGYGGKATIGISRQPGDEPQIESVASKVEVKDGFADILIDVSISLPRRLPSLVLGIGIESPSGLRLYETNTDAMGVQLPEAPGHHRIRIRLERTGFGAGTFSVAVGLGSSQGATYDRNEGSPPFEVPRPKNSSGSGFVAAGARVEIITEN